MADARHDLGRSAEEATAAWLARAGWRILARRHRTAVGGEVDLVAMDPSGILVAVEVRARRTARTGTGAEAIDRRRIARLSRSLTAFAAAAGVRHEGLRIDLVLLEPASGPDARFSARRVPDVGGWLSG
ncbi:MAG: YraN family protein [Chloroflexi bacterium]|nr:YraN family protein [Chloroflexota bacterium]